MRTDEEAMFDAAALLTARLAPKIMITPKTGAHADGLDDDCFDELPAAPHVRRLSMDNGPDEEEVFRLQHGPPVHAPSSSNEALTATREWCRGTRARELAWAHILALVCIPLLLAGVSVSVVLVLGSDRESRAHQGAALKPPTWLSPVDEQPMAPQRSPSPQHPLTASVRGMPPPSPLPPSLPPPPSPPPALPPPLLDGCPISRGYQPILHGYYDCALHPLAERGRCATLGAEGSAEGAESSAGYRVQGTEGATDERTRVQGGGHACGALCDATVHAHMRICTSMHIHMDWWPRVRRSMRRDGVGHHYTPLRDE